MTNGWVLIDKPQGISSYAAVAAVKRKLGVRRAGHAGSLDPLATGVLAVATGRATRTVSLVMAQTKTYVASIRLGFSTSTDDEAGQPQAVQDKAEMPSREALARVLGTFKGQIWQQPPAYSAIKQNGVRAYKLARQGREVLLQRRQVNVHTLERLSDILCITAAPEDKVVESRSAAVQELLSRQSFPVFTLRLTCAQGTYVRALARDIGRALDTHAHLAYLCRTAIGHNHLCNAATLGSLSHAQLQSIATVTGLETLPLDDAERDHLLTGGRLPAQTGTGDLIVAVDNGGQTFALLKRQPAANGATWSLLRYLV